MTSRRSFFGKLAALIGIAAVAPKALAQSPRPSLVLRSRFKKLFPDVPGILRTTGPRHSSKTWFVLDFDDPVQMEQINRDLLEINRHCAKVYEAALKCQA